MRVTLVGAVEHGAPASPNRELGLLAVENVIVPAPAIASRALTRKFTSSFRMLLLNQRVHDFFVHVQHCRQPGALTLNHGNRHSVHRSKWDPGG